MTRLPAADDQKAAELELERELSTLLAVEPSTEFRAGVRARVRAQAPRERRLWVLAGSGATAAALLAAAFVTLQEPAPARLPVQQLSAAQPVPSVRSVTAPALPPRLDREAAARTSPAAPVPRHRVVRSPAAPTGQVLISPDEAAGLELLRVQAAADWRETSTTAEVRERAPGQPMEALVTSRIEIPPLDAVTAIEGVRQ